MTKNRRKLVLAQRRRVRPQRILWVVEVREDATLHLRCNECNRYTDSDQFRRQRGKRSFNLDHARRLAQTLHGPRPATEVQPFVRGDCPHCTKEARDERYPLS